MAYTAIYDGEERGAWVIPAGDDAYCDECGERMRVWREGADGTARHLKHISNMGGGDGGGGGTGCGGGEDDDHIKWKNFAAERLQEIFGDLTPPDTSAKVEERLAAPASNKEHRDADALIYFDPADEQFGRGLAVEVQNKNKDKDIEAVTEDYVRQGIAVVWLYEDDFNNDGCKLNEADFRRKANKCIDSILLDQNPVPWYLHIKRHAEILLDGVRKARAELNRDDCEYVLAEREHHVPAKIPNEHFDEAALDIWRSQDWGYWFEPSQTPNYILQAALTHTDSTSYNSVNLPSDYWEELRRSYWINTDFEKKLRPAESHSFDLDYPIKAKFPRQWDYRRDFHHLSEYNAERSCDICNDNATVYLHGNGFRCGDCGPWPNQRRENAFSTV